MTDPSYTLRDAALAVGCPTCYATPGHVCCSDDGSEIVPVHEDRIDDLRSYVRKGVADYEEEGLRP